MEADTENQMRLVAEARPGSSSNVQQGPQYARSQKPLTWLRAQKPAISRVTRMAYSPSLWLMANWLVKQNQPVSKIETKSDTNLRSLYES
jgi:hypothetical protein